MKKLIFLFAFFISFMSAGFSFGIIEEVNKTIEVVQVQEDSDITANVLLDSLTMSITLNQTTKRADVNGANLTNGLIELVKNTTKAETKQPFKYPVDNIPWRYGEGLFYSYLISDTVGNTAGGMPGNYVK